MARCLSAPLQGKLHVLHLEELAEACLADQRVLQARITIEKPDVIQGCRTVGIAIERRRSSAQPVDEA